MRAKFGKFASISILALSLGGCLMVGGKPMTPVEISTHGTAQYDASPSKVFAATQGALKSEGYEIASADAGKGRIKTGRKLVRVNASAYGSSAVATETTRQYVVTIHSEGGKTVVVAEPRVFVGDRDLSNDPVWDIDGPMGERQLWSQLFRDVREAL
jgi:hypothetical protein